MANLDNGNGLADRCDLTLTFVGRSAAYLVSDNYTGRHIYLPNADAYSYIQFRIVNRGDRLADAYAKKGDDYKSIVPEPYILPAVKLLYTNFYDQFNERRERIPRPFGDWIFDESCIILRGIQEDGRINIGDGFIVPNEKEQECIVQQMFNQGKNISQSMSFCCPDISYPSSVLQFLEEELRGTNYPFYSALRNARTKFRSENKPEAQHGRIILDNGLVVPDSDEIFEIEYGLNSGMDLTKAYFNIAKEILPPENMRKCIEDKLRNTSDSWIDVFKSCQGGNKNLNKNLIYVIGIVFFLFYQQNNYG